VQQSFASMSDLGIDLIITAGNKYSRCEIAADGMTTGVMNFNRHTLCLKKVSHLMFSNHFGKC